MWTDYSLGASGAGAMDLKAIELGTIEELYAFVESAVARTALILDHERTLSSLGPVSVFCIRRFALAISCQAYA
jgi:hypothetical protein